MMRWYLRAIWHCISSTTFAHSMVNSSLLLLGGWWLHRLGKPVWTCGAVALALALAIAVTAAIAATRAFIRAKREAAAVARIVQGVTQEFDKAARGEQQEKQPPKAN